MRKDLKVSGHRLIDLLSQNVPTETEENMKPSIRIVVIVAEFQHMQTTNLVGYS
jgi:hypothetical protein